MKRKLNILFYQPYNKTVVYIESVLEELAKQGHNAFFLSHQERGDTHMNMEKFGCKTFCYPIQMSFPLLYHIYRVYLLTQFCQKYKIDIVYSHYQEANLIAVLAQFFTKAKFVITRHHSDCGYLDHNYKEILGDKIINTLANVYIAPSRKVFDQIVRIEKGDPRKVRLINYGYNFANFQKPNENKVNALRARYKAECIIVEAARLIPEKRHLTFFKVLQRLKCDGFNFKALILGDGPEKEKLKAFVKNNDLEDEIVMLGFQKDIQNYFASADLIVHISVSEASNSAIKEAGLLEKSVVVCKGVGDFDDYIESGYNGFLINKENPEEELYLLLGKLLNGGGNLKQIGKNLKKTVIERFSISGVFEEYNKIHNELGFN